MPLKQIPLKWTESLDRVKELRVESWILSPEQQLQIKFKDPLGGELVLTIQPTVKLETEGKGHYITAEPALKIVLFEEVEE